jgi:hypothetical protein
MKVFRVSYSALTWLLDKIMRLLPTFQMDTEAVERIIKDTFGAVSDKYKVNAISPAL